jgi:hypothetical protein
VIQSHDAGNATNELGCAAREAPALPSDASGAGIAAGCSEAREAMAAINGTTKRRRQG